MKKQIALNGLVLSFLFSISVGHAAGNASLGAATLPTLAPLSTAGVQIMVPIASPSVLESGWSPALGDLKQHLASAYEANCKQAAYTALGNQLDVPIRASEIDELNQPTGFSANSPFPAASCGTASIATNASGFSQATGSMSLDIKMPASPEGADRQMHLVTIPWKKKSSWGLGTEDMQLYRASCAIPKEQAKSTVFLHCSEPAMSVVCCGNADLEGQLTAVVYAYANPKWKSVVHTAKTQLEMDVMNSSYLAQEFARLGSDLAFSICTPANFEYAPVMALQSTCYTLEQTYKPLNPTLRTCAGATSDGMKIWVLQKHGMASGQGYLFLAARTSRMTSSTTDAYTLSSAGAVETLQSKSGAVLRVPVAAGPAPATATLENGSKMMSSIKDPSVAMTCTNDRGR